MNQRRMILLCYLGGKKMKVFTLYGISKSGKTTTAEHVIKELRNRGYSVGSVKNIHADKFAIDKEGSNTHRHKQAGSQLVTARGRKETDILFQETLPMDVVLSFYHHDFVVLEGNSSIKVPNIITAHNLEEIDERMNDLAIAVAGKISNTMIEYRGIPVINGITDVIRLVDLIEEKVPHYGQTESAGTVSINGKEAPLSACAQSIVKNLIKDTNPELEGDEEIEIIIKLKRS